MRYVLLGLLVLGCGGSGPAVPGGDAGVEEGGDSPDGAGGTANADAADAVATGEGGVSVMLGDSCASFEGRCAAVSPLAQCDRTFRGLSCVIACEGQERLLECGRLGGDCLVVTGDRTVLGCVPPNWGADSPIDGLGAACSTVANCEPLVGSSMFATLPQGIVCADGRCGIRCADLVDDGCNRIGGECVTWGGTPNSVCLP